MPFKTAKHLSLSLSALALMALVPAQARDLTQDILNQPSTTLTETGRRSDPVAEAPSVRATPETIILRRTQAQATIKTETQAAPAILTSAAIVPAARPQKMQPIMDEAGVKTAAAQTPAATAAATPAPVTKTDTETAPVALAPASVSTPSVSTPAPAATPLVSAPASPLAVQPALGQGAQLAGILSAAYTESPALRAEREALRAQYENVAVAESGRRPIVTAEGGASWLNTDTNPGGRDSLFARDIGVNATQYLYRGGRTLAEIERQLRLSDAALAAYDSATQNVFLNVVTAAMDIQRSRATIDLTRQNREVISRQLETASRGFDVGELTRTDVAQAQARLSGADAQLVASEAAFSSAVARYRQFAGAEGGDLVVDVNAAALPVPQSLESALAAGETDNPRIRTAIEAEKAAQSAIRAAQGELLPTLAAQAGATAAWDPSAMVDDTKSASLGLRASVPLYEGGASRARVRQAKYSQREQRDRIADAKRAVQQAVTTAWNDHKAALAQIDARSKQVEAAEIARNGVYREREVGTRTVLDTLDADAELLDAQVAQVQARRDAVVAAYALMAATGQLTAEKQGLFSAEAERAKIRNVQARWLGTGIDAQD